MAAAGDAHADGSTGRIGAACGSGSGCQGCTGQRWKPPSRCCPFCHPQPRAAPTCPGFAAPAPTLRGRTAGRGQGKGLRSTRRTRDRANRVRGRGGKGSCRPLCSPGSLSPGREGKATCVAELTPPEREWVVIAWSFTAQAAKPSVVRQTPKFPGTGHRHHSRSHRRGHRHAVSATVI